MPVEIRELIIKTTVDTAEKEKSNEDGTVQSSSSSGSGDSDDANKMKESIITECMNRIMDHFSNDQQR